MSSGDSGPSISVVVPAFNAERYIHETLRAVSEQTLRVHECIVVDDGSTDRTAAVVEAGEIPLEVSLLRRPNSGVSKARNAGAALATGEFLSFLDADDVWVPERMARMVEPLLKGADAVVSATTLSDQDLRPQGVQEVLRIPTKLEILVTASAPVSLGSNLIIRRDVFTRLGGFDTTLSTSADWELFLRLVDGCAVSIVPEPLTLYRRHGEGMSRSIDLMANDKAAVYDREFGGAECPWELEHRARARLHWMLAGSFADQRRYGRALGHGIVAIRHVPAFLAPATRAAIRRGLRVARPAPKPASPKPSIGNRGFWRLNSALASIARQAGAPWLTYNPLQMHAYHLLAKESAKPFMEAVTAAFPGAERLLDVGAGTGAYASAGLDLGRRVLALERSRVGRLYARAQGVSTASLELGITSARASGPADLAYSLEVAEHLSPEIGDLLVGFLAESAPVVVFSAAQPGQGGVDHINEQPKSYWIDRFSEAGMDFDGEATRLLLSELALKRGISWWLLENVMVFRRAIA